MKNVLPAPCFSISNYVPSLSSRSLCESRAFVGSRIVYFYVLLYTQLGLCLEKIYISIPVPTVPVPDSRIPRSNSERLNFFGLEILGKYVNAHFTPQITIRCARPHTSPTRVFTQFGLCVKKSRCLASPPTATAYRYYRHRGGAELSMMSCAVILSKYDVMI